METSSETAAEPAGQNESTAEATGSAALQGEASNGTDAEEAVDGALDEDELLAEIPEVAEPVYSHLADNTIVQVDASRNLLEQVGDQLLGARRASLQETVSADSGRTAELVSYSRAFIDAAVEYKCVPLLHGGYLLYNGGFTGCILACLFVPVLEHFCKTKKERKELRARK